MPIYNQIFGAFSKDSSNPLSRISQANSCISLDPFVGCPLNCAYCYRHNSKRDTSHNIPKRIFNDEEIVDALITHPYFIPHKTIIGISTASTEAFLPKVADSTFKIMELLVSKGLKNPFWLVIKSGVSDNSYKRFKNIINNCKGIIISVSYSSMPPEVEPFRGNRFRNIKEAINAGAHVSLHLRPIVPGWNDRYKNIEKAILKGVREGCQSICVGGLRFLEGIKYAITKRGKLKFSNIGEDELKKILPSKIMGFVKKVLKEHNINLSVFLHSSEVISNFLGMPDYNLYRYRGDKKIFLRIPLNEQLNIEKRKNKTIKSLIKEAIQELGLKNCKVETRKERIILLKQLSYSEERALIHRLGLEKFFSL